MSHSTPSPRRLLPVLLGLLLALSAAGAARAQGGTCDAPGGVLGPPACACQYQDGDTTGAGSDFWEVELTAGTTYTFTLCNATCPDAAADYDTRLRVYDPSCNTLADVDDSCGLLSEVVLTADVSGPHVIEVTGFSSASEGTYTLGWVEGGGAPSCDMPSGALDVPTTDCQTLDDELCGADDAYYTVELVTGWDYTFTLCDGTCPGAGASFDSRLELVAPDGTVVATSDDACGDQAELTYTPGPPHGDGQYCVRVNRAAADGDEFTLGWFVGCEPPTDPTLAPDSGNVSGEDCTKEVSFVAQTMGTGQFDWEWTIVPGPGTAASPTSFTETTDGDISIFSTTLDGAGTYDVSVVVTNDCGMASRSISYLLEDLRGPDLTCFAEPCFDGPPAPDAAPAPGPEAGPVLQAFAETAWAPRTGSAEPVEPTVVDFDAVREILLSEADPGAAREALAAKLDMMPSRIVIRDERDPGLFRPPTADALGCATPCLTGTITQSHPFYDVFLSCADGSFTARTGAVHSVTVGSGSPQNVIFGGAGGNPGTSDVSWFVHDSGDHFLDPTGGEACTFDPADTATEPNNLGLEMEWEGITPLPGVELTLREEIVAFGDLESNSGIRLTLGATSSPSSVQPVTMGVRWQIDYQNASDDGPLYAGVQCDPFTILDERSTEHEFDPDTEIFDFYRIQNNSGSPIFANFTSTAPIAGFPDTAKPDRLIYGVWSSLLNSDWDYVADEGDPGPDSDSATLVYYGHQAADGITIAPGETFTRSVIIFTQGEEQDCGTFVPGSGVNADLEICPNTCVRLGAEGVDNCTPATVTLVDFPAGGPPCIGNPCELSFPDEGTFTYTWEAVDAAGNSTTCTSTVRVVDDGGCNAPPTCDAGGPYESDCRNLVLDGATAEDLDGDELTWEWTSSDPAVSVSPASGVLPGTAPGAGPQALPPVTVTLDASVPPCGVEAVLTLRVVDTAGAESTCETTVRFEDTEPPTLAGDGTGSLCSWPPNHSYVCVPLEELDIVVTDSCTEPVFRLEDCLSNQPDEAPVDDSDFNGDGNFTDDCVVSPDGSMVCFRSERAGGGAEAQAGREYTLRIVARDECGNESGPLPALTISIAHDQSPEAREGCFDPTKVGLKKNEPFPWEVDVDDSDDGD